jgi:hypothetical protein
MQINIFNNYIMLGHKGKPTGRFGQKGVQSFNLIGGLHKSHGMNEKKTMKEMVAKANKYGALEKK